MSQPPYLIAPNPGDQEVYFKQVGKNETPNYRFPVAEKQDNVAIGVLGMPYRLPFDKVNPWDDLELVAWLLFLLLLFGLGAVVLWKILKERINIKDLLSEGDGKASLSRFQAFLFTFVFVIGVMLILIRTGQFPTEIPFSVLAILGGSLGTYLISKGLSRSDATATTAAVLAPSRGPLLRMRPVAEPFQVNVQALKSLSSGSALFVLPTVVGEPQHYTVVAVAVGRNELVLRPHVRSGAVVNGKAQYVNDTGNVQTVAFVGETRVTTPERWITEVGVAFTADTADEPVELEVGLA